MQTRFTPWFQQTLDARDHGSHQQGIEHEDAEGCHTDQHGAPRSDARPRKNAKEAKALVDDKFTKRVIFTKRKMGAQTLEALVHASVGQLSRKMS